MEAIITLPVGLVIAIVTAWVTVRWSLDRFRAEKLWEMKVTAYRTVIEALHEASKYPEAHFDAAVEGYKVSEETEKELRLSARKASIEILRATESGGLLLPSRVLCRLKKYHEERMNADYSGEDIATLSDLHLAAINACLKDVIEIARQDLKIN